MGTLFSKKDKHHKILIVGLDAAGKTTILYNMKKDQIYKQTIATVGFNCEELTFKKCSFTVWDIGGQEKIRRLWSHYFKAADAVIFVVDSSAVGRMDEAKKELELVLKDPELHASVPLLILANKQDLEDSLRPDEVGEKVVPLAAIGDRSWKSVGCIGKNETITEVYDGFDWLITCMNKS